jgi:hypothetical protein
MPLSVSVLLLDGGLPPDSRPVRIGVSCVGVGGVFGVEGAEDLVRCTVKTVAHEQRAREDKRQEYPTRPTFHNGPDILHPSHLNRLSTFYLTVYIPLGGI